MKVWFIIFAVSITFNIFISYNFWLSCFYVFASWQFIVLDNNKSATSKTLLCNLYPQLIVDSKDLWVLSSSGNKQSKTLVKVRLIITHILGYIIPILKQKCRILFKQVTGHESRNGLKSRMKTVLQIDTMFEFVSNVNGISWYINTHFKEGLQYFYFLLTAQPKPNPSLLSWLDVVQNDSTTSATACLTLATSVRVRQLILFHIHFDANRPQSCLSTFLLSSI